MTDRSKHDRAEAWVDTIHQIRTGKDYYFEVGPSPELEDMLELHYCEVDTAGTNVKASISFSVGEALVIGRAIVTAAYDLERNSRARLCGASKTALAVRQNFPTAHISLDVMPKAERPADAVARLRDISSWLEAEGEDELMADADDLADSIVSAYK